MFEPITLTSPCISEAVERLVDELARDGLYVTPGALVLYTLERRLVVHLHSVTTGEKLGWIAVKVDDKIFA